MITLFVGMRKEMDLLLNSPMNSLTGFFQNTLSTITFLLLSDNLTCTISIRLGTTLMNIVLVISSSIKIRSKPSFLSYNFRTLLTQIKRKNAGQNNEKPIAF